MPLVDPFYLQNAPWWVWAALLAWMPVVLLIVKRGDPETSDHADRY
ncbi:hypothetical protein [Kushneria indalinina]|nr:hypothetical protein [Kushneria indalinina]